MKKLVMRPITALAVLSATAMVGLVVPAQAQAETAGLDTGTLQDSGELSVELQGSLKKVNESGSLDDLLALLGKINGLGQIPGLELLAGIPGGIQDVAATAARVAAGQATIDDLLRTVSAVLAPVQPCNSQTKAGQTGNFYIRHEIGRRGPSTVRFTFNTYRIPDELTVSYEGRTVYHYSGSTGSEQTVDIALPPGVSTSLQVAIKAEQSGTEWDYTVGCAF